MDLYNAEIVKPSRNPLPSIQPSYKINKSDQRFRSVDKGHPKVAASGNLRNPDISISDGFGGLEESDNENRVYSKGSMNDVPPTCDTSKASFNKSRHKKSLKRSPQRESSKERRSSPKKIKSENPSVLRELLSKQGNATPFGKASQNLKPTVPEVRPPKISAKCWALMDARNGEIIGTKKGNKKREIASLTKMMTCLCVCKLIRQYGINPKSIYIQVSKVASSVGGTSAHLQHKDILSIWDLMHGLMLPSGNDAAMSLAESFGSYIYLKSEKCKQRTKMDPLHSTKKVKNAVKYFLNLMNKTAVELELKNTYYANPHGLINTDSYSTAADQAKLTFEVLKMELIREIVNKTEYLCEIEHPDGSVRTSRWENTNKLLGRKGWFGVKTGVTTAAGPSLSAYYQHENDMYIIILLNSATMDLRWLESIKLVDWANKHKGQKNLVF